MLLYLKGCLTNTTTQEGFYVVKTEKILGKYRQEFKVACLVHTVFLNGLKRRINIFMI